MIVICADALEWLVAQGENSLDAIVTDPPYGLEMVIVSVTGAARLVSFRSSAGGRGKRRRKTMIDQERVERIKERFNYGYTKWDSKLSRRMRSDIYWLLRELEEVDKETSDE